MLKLNPDRLKVALTREIGRHRPACGPVRGKDGRLQNAQKLSGRNSSKVCATQQNSLVFQAFGNQLNKPPVIILYPEDFRSSVSRKGGRIKNDQVKFSSLLMKAPQPVEDIADEELVVFGADPVELVV